MSRFKDDGKSESNENIVILFIYPYKRVFLAQREFGISKEFIVRERKKLFKGIRKRLIDHLIYVNMVLYGKILCSYINFA